MFPPRARRLVSFGGALKDLSPVDLGAHAMKAALERAGVDGGDLDLYIFGNVLRAGHGQLVPRQAAVQAGIPQSVDGYAIDMVCSSAMMTVMNAAMAIKSGEADLGLDGRHRVDVAGGLCAFGQGALGATKC